MGKKAETTTVDSDEALGEEATFDSFFRYRRVPMRALEWEVGFIEACDIPKMLASSEFHNKTRPFSVFIYGWNLNPPHRQAMIRKKPVCDEVLAGIGTVVHGLCLRDNVEAPKWALNAKSAVPRVIGLDIGIDSRWGQRVREKAPAVCHLHNVYFEEEFYGRGWRKFSRSSLVVWVCDGIGQYKGF